MLTGTQVKMKGHQAVTQGHLKKLRSLVKVNTWVITKAGTIVILVCNSTFYFLCDSKNKYVKNLIYIIEHTMYKDVTSIIEMWGEENQAVQEQSLHMLLKLSGYKFKLDCHNFRMLSVIPMETTKTISITYIHKYMRKE